MAGRDADGLAPPLLIGFAVASAGGPLAIAAVYILHAATVRIDALTTTALLGAVIFAAPMLIWASYGRTIASSGGLFDYVRAAAGDRLALVQGTVWSFSYLLYLPYTVAYVVYDLLPDVLHVHARYMVMLEVALPLAISLLVAAGRRAPVIVLAASAAAQLIAVAVMGALVLSRTGLHVALLPHATVLAPPSALGGAQMAFLFVCINLVLFLGGEARGGAPTMRRSLVIGFVLVAAASVLAALFLTTAATPAVLHSDMPGVTLARARFGPATAVAIGLFALASVTGVIVSEFVALSRLWQSMFSWRLDRSILGIGLWFVATGAVSLVNPPRFYSLSLPPSLVALFASQFIVFAVYPRFNRKSGKPSLALNAAALVAAVWSLYGLYSVFAGPPAS